MRDEEESFTYEGDKCVEQIAANVYWTSVKSREETSSN